MAISKASIPLESGEHKYTVGDKEFKVVVTEVPKPRFEVGQTVYHVSFGGYAKYTVLEVGTIYSTLKSEHVSRIQYPTREIFASLEDAVSALVSPEVAAIYAMGQRLIEMCHDKQHTPAFKLLLQEAYKRELKPPKEVIIYDTDK